MSEDNILYLVLMGAILVGYIVHTICSARVEVEEERTEQAKAHNPTPPKSAKPRKNGSAVQWVIVALGADSSVQLLGPYPNRTAADREAETFRRMNPSFSTTVSGLSTDSETVEFTLEKRL